MRAPREYCPVPRKIDCRRVSSRSRGSAQSVHSLSPGVYISGWAKRSNQVMVRSTIASVHSSAPDWMSPTWTEKSGASRLMSPIIRS